MHVLSLECTAYERDRLIAELWERGTEGIIEEQLPDGAWRLRAFFAGTFGIESLAAFRPGWSEAEDRDWVAESRAQWQPLAVGRRFYLVPEWLDAEAPPDRLRLTVNPGRACGTGLHTATQLCLEALERHLRPGETVLDAGTGSGILAVAASLLGGRRILACDIDLEACRAASEALRNAGAGAGVWAGSLGAARDGAADVLVANLNAETLCRLAPAIARTTRRLAILSGFRVEDRDRLPAALLEPVEEITRDGWLALVLSAGRLRKPSSR